MSVQVAHRLFSTAEYHGMIAAGILTPDDRVELIEGEIYQMPAMGSRHAGCIRRLTHFFNRQVGERGLVSVQNPIELDDSSEPEPDVAVLRFRDDFYADSHPRPADVLLAIEVADTTREFDRRVKLPMYARAGIAELWLVDLEEGAVEIFHQPQGADYRQRERRGRGQSLSPAALPEVELAVADLLG